MPAEVGVPSGLRGELGASQHRAQLSTLVQPEGKIHFIPRARERDEEAKLYQFTCDVVCFAIWSVAPSLAMRTVGSGLVRAELTHLRLLVKLIHAGCFRISKIEPKIVN